jgi:hypothetical protein
MEHLSKRADDAIDRLIRFARGDRALVSTAVAKYNSGEIGDLIRYIDERRPKRAEPAMPPTTSPNPKNN